MKFLFFVLAFNIILNPVMAQEDSYNKENKLEEKNIFINTLKEKSNIKNIDNDRLIEKRIERFKNMSNEEFRHYKRKKLKSLTKEERIKIKKRILCKNLISLNRELTKENSELNSYLNYIEKNKFLNKMPLHRKEILIERAKKYYKLDNKEKEEAKNRMEKELKKICHN